jgi:trans-AT polyketide synthase/acyltransferase/oxidoreductase domain-containing protein
MAEVFIWYLRESRRWAIEGNVDEKLNFQIPCDESMAAFNAYVAGSDLAVVSGRGVVAIAERLMQDGDDFMRRRLGELIPR